MKEYLNFEVNLFALHQKYNKLYPQHDLRIHTEPFT